MKHTIFISYAHEDAVYKDELRKKLKIWELQKELGLEFWVDDNISGGQDWRAEIDGAMERADLGILLLSDDFIGSEFILNHELNRLRERYEGNRLKLFPIVVRPCESWQEVPFLKSLQVNPMWRTPVCLSNDAFERGKDLDRIAKSIKEALDKPAPELNGIEAEGAREPPRNGKPAGDPHTYADLEAGLYHHAFHEYQLELRFSHSGPNQRNRLEHRCIRLNPETLVGPAEDLGYKLGSLLFGEEGLRNVLDHAMDTAREILTPLRLRICIGPNGRELCRVPWETLRHPISGKFLACDPEVQFTRFLLGKGQPPLKPLRYGERSQFRAVVSPLKAFLPLDVEPDADGCDHAREVEFARRRLTALEGEVGTFEGVPLADWESMDRGVGKCDLLYLVCSRFGSVDGDHWETTPTGQCPSRSGQPLVRSLGYLPTLPRLVVMSPPIGTAMEDQEFGVLGDVAAAIADAGVPAVITVQGNVCERTWGKFLDGFFGCLSRDGNLTVALAEARRAVGDAPDWWAPILLTRCRSGDFWRRPGFEDSVAGETTWEVLINKITAGRCTPILGPGMLAPYIGSRETIAKAVADEYFYPLAFQDRANIQQVTQYLQVDVDDRWMMVRKLEEVMRRHLANLHGIEFESRGGNDSLDALIMDVGARKMRYKRDPYRLLAQLPFPLYITTNLNGLMTLALKNVKKKPQEEVYSLHDRHLEDRTVRPSAEEPLVFHLFGRFNDPYNTVITEDDYLDFLIHFGADEKNVNRTARKIPEVVYGAMTGHSLVFVGFQVHQWDFRVLYRTLMSLEGSAYQQGKTHVAVQIDPDDDHTLDPGKARRYFQSMFSAKGSRAKVHIYWGSTEDFIKELYARVRGDLPADDEDAEDPL